MKKIQLKTSWIVIILTSICLSCLIIVLEPLNKPPLNWDDNEQVTNNSQVNSFQLQHIPKIFSSYYAGMYQPLATISFALEYRISGGAPGAHRLVNWLLHSLNIVLVFWLSQLIWRRRNLSLIAAAAFAWWPTQVEVYAWISARSTLLATAFSLAGLIAYYHYLIRRRGRYYAWALLFFIGACLSKAVAISLPFLFLIGDYWWRRNDKWRCLWEKIPLLVISLIFGLIAIKARESTGINLAESTSLLINWLTIAYTFLWQLKLLLLPVNLSPFYGQPLVNGQLNFTVWLSVSLLPLIFMWLSLRRRAWLWAAFAWFAFSVLPSIQIAPHIKTAGADRYNYLAVLAIAWPLAWWLSNDTPAKKFKIIYAAAIAIFIINTGYQQAGTWSSNLNLWSAAAIYNPAESTTKAWLAEALFTQKKCPEAYATILSAVALDDRYPEHHNILGTIEFWCWQHSEKALRHFQKAIELKPDFSIYHYNAGLALISQQSNKAIEAFDNALALNQKESINHQTLYLLQQAEAYRLLGNTQQACLTLQKVKKINYNESIPPSLQSLCPTSNR